MTSIVAMNEAEKRPVSIQKKKKKRRNSEKKLPFLGQKFDDLVNFDVFDFVQFKTQMKIMRLRAEERKEGVQDLNELIAQIPSSKKRKLKKPKAFSKKRSRHSPLNEAISEESINNFLEKNPDIISRKTARALLKTNKYIKEYLTRHPDIPVEKSHKSMRPLKEMQKKLQSQGQQSHSQSLSASGMKSQRTTAATEVTSGVSELNTITKGDEGSNMHKEPPEIETIDHVAAINSWIQKNYNNLSTTQKQLVHMQLQYLNNLKKTSFQNQAFVLSAQHLNNLNNVGFLHANFNPFNRNYTNFVSIPSYSVDSNQPNMQLLNALQQQQQQQQQANYRVQMPLNFLSDPKDTANGPRKNGTPYNRDSQE